MPQEIFGYQIPWDMLLANKEALMIAGIGIVTAIIVLLLMREFMAWFSKVSSLIASQKVTQALMDEQNDLLAEQNSLLRSFLASIETAEPEKTIIMDPSLEKPVVKKVPSRTSSSKKSKA